MQSEARTHPKRKFTIAGGFIVITAIAAVFGLGSLWSDRGGLYLAIPAATIPFSIVVEFALRNSARKREMPKNITLLWRLVAIVVFSALPALAAWIGLLNQGTWWSPCPYLMFLSYAYLEAWLMEWPSALFVIPSISYLILMVPSAFESDNRRLPIRSVTVLIVATLTSAFWFLSSTAGAFEYQSTSYIIGGIAVNLTIMSLLWGTCLLAWRRFRFPSSLAWHLTLICWLFWLAYPWLGESI